MTIKTVSKGTRCVYVVTDGDGAERCFDTLPSAETFVRHYSYSVSSETCSVCGMYSDEAFHGICQESVTA